MTIEISGKKLNTRQATEPCPEPLHTPHSVYVCMCVFLCVCVHAHACVLILLQMCVAKICSRKA